MIEHPAQLNLAYLLHHDLGDVDNDTYSLSMTELTNEARSAASHEQSTAPSSPGTRQHPSPAKTTLQSSPTSKRPLPVSASHSLETLDGHDSKRSRQTVQWPYDDAVRGRQGSIGNSPGLFSRERSSSPGQGPFLDAAATMLSRAEETGGNRIVKLARGMPGSPVPVRSAPHSSTRHTSDHSADGRTRADSDSAKSTATHLLHSVGLAEYLQLDDRPIFTVDLHDDANVADSEGLHILFANSALRARPALYNHVRGRIVNHHALSELGTPFADFRSWALNPSNGSETVLSFPFDGVLWKSSIIRKRLKILTGQAQHLHAPEDLEVAAKTVSQNGLRAPASADPRARASSPGYFDVKPQRNPGLPSTLQTLTQESHHETSSRSPVEATPTPGGGDLGHYELLSGPLSPSSEQRTLPGMTDRDMPENGLLKSITDNGYFDWTRLPLTPALPDHVHFARSIDWAATSLGPMDQWELDLRLMCNLVMASPNPSAMYWGRQHVAIYNEPYILLAGQKHPSLMGARYRDAWSEIWDALEEVFDNAFDNAQATMKDDDCLFLYRNGYLEETYFSWSIIPLIGDDGSVVGLYNPAFEKTRRKVAERRMLTLREIGERTSAARQVSQFWSLLLDGLAYNEYDAPLVMLYSLGNESLEGDKDVEPSSASSSGAANKTAQLEGTLGISAGHKAAPESIDLRTSMAGFAFAFRQALTQDRPIVLRVDDGTIDASLLEDIEWRGFGDPSRSFVVCPIHPTTGESTLGFLVMGMNPRRPYDEDYDLFIQLLARQLATSIASVVLFEDEIRKGEQAAQLAAQDRIELNNQLVARTQQAVEAENKFTRMAELAPVGMYIGDSTGKIVFVNDAWYDMTRYPREKAVGNDWIDCVVDEDRPKAWEIWTKMMTLKCPISTEFRFKTPYKDKTGHTGYTWVLASASPEKDEDGNIKRVFGSVTDISSQKFAENVQTRRMEEAVEMKRQQERYIDTTSHEMRNPLSAILQSADAITSSLTELRDETNPTGPQKDILELTIDSAQTITLCAQHQKRIVDDVLTLSKLDSAMMVVTPVDAQPVTVVQRALKMFEGELNTADIDVDFKVDNSYKQMKIDWVRIDPHRLSQVLINLTTNAIKFTTTQEKRTIRMFVAASTERPNQEDKWGLTYIPTRLAKERDVTASPEWGMGETVYIHFAVQDTGRGLDDVEKEQLFQRFKQANPRTHVTYGGSGLGLFISRELVELQGGEIGVASEAGKGSTFAFYLKARRSTEPPTHSSEVAENLITSGYQVRKGSRGTKLTKGRPVLATHQSSPNTSQLPKASRTYSSREADTALHVLVVEDNLINQKVLATQLRKIGCVVHVANHGGEAIDIIETSTFHRSHQDDKRHSHIPFSTSTANHKSKPDPPPGPTQIDVVLMDLEMPIMDGQTCARKLRVMQKEGELVRHIPVIAVTANAREEQIRLTLESGIDDVVSKPFRIADLVPKMRDVVARFAPQEAGGDAQYSKAGLEAQAGKPSNG